MTFGRTGDGARIKEPAKVKEVLETFKSFGYDELGKITPVDWNSSV